MAGDEEAYLRASVGIDDFDIQAEFVRVSSDLAYWNNLYAQAYRTWQRAKMDLETLTAQLSIAIRDQLTAQAKARVTLAEVDQILHTTVQWRQAREAEISGEYEKVRLYGVLDAIRSKRDMLVSLGAHMRAEMGNDPMIRQRASVDTAVRNGARHE